MLMTLAFLPVNLVPASFEILNVGTLMIKLRPCSSISSESSFRPQETLSLVSEHSRYTAFILKSKIGLHNIRVKCTSGRRTLERSSFNF
ncbi:hypothetical protein T4A_8174 [Trichinella pseudospiralis]|uniref:Uncharacterized protein n=1 Tax=Trichinella pseudospiralis TaxID=6337 RepID=A0A0V1JZM0_TRIPS|nr:hypothetical protein T4A_8174 [Trichinella pseudospiralis]KRZ40312.1 hypothetical protein T4C_2977 [Trichinella pseudospiralis]